MASIPYWARLPGPSHRLNYLPQPCPVCESKRLYKQADFRRSIGLWLVGIACLMTVVLTQMGFGWFWIWSPMLGFLIFDRVMAYLTPLAVICYRCETIYRGLTHEQAMSFPDFDLEIYDRVKYPERVAAENGPSASA